MNGDSIAGNGGSTGGSSIPGGSSGVPDSSTTPDGGSGTPDGGSDTPGESHLTATVLTGDVNVVAKNGNLYDSTVGDQTVYYVKGDTNYSYLYFDLGLTEITADLTEFRIEYDVYTVKDHQFPLIRSNLVLFGGSNSSEVFPSGYNIDSNGDTDFWVTFPSNSIENPVGETLEYSSFYHVVHEFKKNSYGTWDAAILFGDLSSDEVRHSGDYTGLVFDKDHLYELRLQLNGPPSGVSLSCLRLEDFKCTLNYGESSDTDSDASTNEGGNDSGGGAQFVPAPAPGSGSFEQSGNY